MNLAGHADFETTRRFYLAISKDLVHRARRVSEASMKSAFGTHLAHTLKKEMSQQETPIVPH